MQIIYYHPKDVFTGIVSVGKKEVLAFAAIITLMVFAIRTHSQYIAHLSTGLEGQPPRNFADLLFLPAAMTILYIAGRMISAVIIKNKNVLMNEQIDAACLAVEETTGVQIDNLEMAHLIDVATIDGPQMHTAKVDNIEYRIVLSFDDEHMLISYDSLVQA